METHENKQTKPSKPNFQASTSLWGFSRKCYFCFNLSLINLVPSSIVILSKVMGPYFTMGQQAFLH